MSAGSHLTSEHPQLLRLEKAVLRMLQAKSPQGGDGGQGQDVTGAFKRLLVEWVSFHSCLSRNRRCFSASLLRAHSLRLYNLLNRLRNLDRLRQALALSPFVQAKSTPAPNQALQDPLWMSDVADAPQMLLEQGHLPLLLDLNDANLTFEMLHGHFTSELQQAPATIIPAKSKASTSNFSIRKPIILLEDEDMTMGDICGQEDSHDAVRLREYRSTASHDTSF